MPNRILKESIRTSDTINVLKPIEEVLFYRLMVSCDDYGRFDGRTAIIKGTCFPLRDTTNKDIENALSKLSTVGLITLYEVEGKPFLQLCTWEQHQNIRAKKSKYPAVNEGRVITSVSRCMQMNTDVPVIQSNPNPNPNPNTMCKKDAFALFESLWKLYPNKKGKGQISDTKKSVLLKIGIDEISRAIQRYELELKKDEWRKPQNGSTFFNSGYVDYLDANYKNGKEGDGVGKAGSRIGENENGLVERAIAAGISGDFEGF